MLRVLMVLEDYGELMFLQTVLKKMGFDVDAIQNPRSFQDSLLRMNPDVLVMTGFGKRVRGVDLIKDVKKARGIPKVMMLKNTGHFEQSDVAIDMWQETPLTAVGLLNAIGELCGLNKEVLQEKFSKLHIQEAQDEHERVLKINDIAGLSLGRSESTGNFGVLKASSMPSDERNERYAKFVAEEKPENHGFAVKQVQEQIKALRKDESVADLADLERERKAFVEHLFKKKAN